MKLLREKRESMIFSYPKNKQAKRKIDLCDLTAQMKDNISELVKKTADYYFTQLYQAVDGIIDDRSKIVLLSGPSGSGKTTTAGKIAAALDEKGKKAHVISIDDFFVGKGNYPLLPDGSEDFESVYALDLNLFRKTVDDILSQDKVFLPRFDFTTSTRQDNAYSIDLSENDIIIFEGIHALNPLLLPENHRHEVFRLYVAVKGQVFDGDKKVFASSDIRMLRRMIRDNLFRNYPHVRTVRIWQNVVDGEERWIYPFRDTADAVIDTTHPYELGLYKQIIDKTPDLDGFDGEEEVIRKLAKKLSVFPNVSKDVVPKDALIREFIG